VLTREKQKLRHGQAVGSFWIGLAENLRRQVGQPHFESWLSRLSCLGYSRDRVDLVSPNSFTKDWIQGHYLQVLRDAIAEVDGCEREPKILLAGELEEYERSGLPLIGELAENDRIAYWHPRASVRAPTVPLVGAGNGNQGNGNRARAAEKTVALGAVIDDVLAPTGPGDVRPGSEADPAARNGQSARHSRSGGFGSRSGAVPDGAGRMSPVGTNGVNGSGEVGRRGLAQGHALSGASVSEAPTAGETAAATVPSAEPRTGPNPSSLDFFHGNSDFVLNNAFTFDNFVIGGANELAAAAAKAVAEYPAGPYNPFFIHGASGLGKTHLLQAICHAVLARSVPRRVMYLSCESFVNQFIAAISAGQLDTFRYKYRKVDLLLIDDIQFLEGKTRTQEEFFHTFNTLFNAQKQIVLSSDRPPKEIATLQERLVSRFGWGMVTSLEAPCLETRVAIVKRKAQMRGVDFPGGIAQMLAEQIDSNIRELEGAVTRLIGWSNLMGRSIDEAMVQETLRDLLGARPEVGVQDVLETVAKEFGVLPRELQSRRRIKSVVIPRHIGIYLSRRLTRHSLEEIGGFFGGRDHSTVLHSIRKVEELVEADADIKERIERLSGVLSRA